MGFEDAYIQWQVKVSHACKTLKIIKDPGKGMYTETGLGTKRDMVAKASQVVGLSSGEG